MSSAARVTRPPRPAAPPPPAIPPLPVRRFTVEEYHKLIENGMIDILFSNEGEIQFLAQIEDFEKALARFADKVPVLVSTCGERGAVAIVDGVRHEAHAAPVEHIIDTTGAGDLFAAGFLAAHIEGRSVEQCLSLGAAAAAEVISHWGARPEEDLTIIRDRLFFGIGLADTRHPLLEQGRPGTFQPGCRQNHHTRTTA